MSEKGKKQILLISDHYDYGGVATTHSHLAEVFLKLMVKFKNSVKELEVLKINIRIRLS